MDFILKQGENAIQQNYAAHGALDSGAAMKALRDYAQNTAQSNYFMPYMGLLGGQQAVGAQAGSSVAGVGQNFGSTAANIYGGMGNTLQNGANGAAEAAATRGLAGANLGYGIANGLGQLASSFVPTSSGVYGGGPISVSPTGTSNYFGSNPFGGSI
jgi:hypothetical protein